MPRSRVILFLLDAEPDVLDSVLGLVKVDADVLTFLVEIDVFDFVVLEGVSTPFLSRDLNCRPPKRLVRLLHLSLDCQVPEPDRPDYFLLDFLSHSRSFLPPSIYPLWSLGTDMRSKLRACPICGSKKLLKSSNGDVKCSR